jgi:hypothetical protein
MTTALLLQALDLVLISLLVGAIYWPRHRRRDLVVAYIGVNIGVLAVAAVLANATVTAGLGLGLFGVLSIIRLRSDELSQGEIAYYFASLALGLVAGIGATPLWLSIGFMVLIVAALAVVDSPALMARHRRTDLVLDRAFLDEGELRVHLSHLLDSRITSVTVHEIDQVRDTTTVTVRHQDQRWDRGAERPDADAPGTAGTTASAPSAASGPRHALPAPAALRETAVTGGAVAGGSRAAR